MDIESINKLRSFGFMPVSENDGKVNYGIACNKIDLQTKRLIEAQEITILSAGGISYIEASQDQATWLASNLDALKEYAPPKGLLPERIMVAPTSIKNLIEYYRKEFEYENLTDEQIAYPETLSDHPDYTCLIEKKDLIDSRISKNIFYFDANCNQPRIAKSYDDYLRDNYHAPEFKGQIFTFPDGDGKFSSEEIDQINRVLSWSSPDKLTPLYLKYDLAQMQPKPSKDVVLASLAFLAQIEKPIQGTVSGAVAKIGIDEQLKDPNFTSQFDPSRYDHNLSAEEIERLGIIKKYMEEIVLATPISQISEYSKPDLTHDATDRRKRPLENSDTRYGGATDLPADAFDIYMGQDVSKALNRYMHEITLGVERGVSPENMLKPLDVLVDQAYTGKGASQQYQEYKKLIDPKTDLPPTAKENGKE